MKFPPFHTGMSTEITMQVPVQETLLLQFHKYLFHAMSKGYYLTAGTLGFWLLQTFSFCFQVFSVLGVRAVFQIDSWDKQPTVIYPVYLL